MDVEIVNRPFSLEIYGFSGIAINKDYSGTAFSLSGKMWQVVKDNNLNNKGLNVWVYEHDDKVFTGVELEKTLKKNNGLERKIITFQKYAHYKHIGSYKLIKNVGHAMTNDLKQRGFETDLPYIEIYGHWTSDETKLETDLYMSLL